MALTGRELVAFAKSKLGTPYVYGTKGELLTEEKYNYLKKRYGSMVWDSDKKKIGEVCVDCSGLISWYTGKLLSSSQLKEQASACNPIYTIVSAPIGAILWQKGHVGIYTGLEAGIPYYIAADGSAYGVRKNKVSNSGFTNWLLMPWIRYGKTEKEELTPEKRDIKIDNISYTTHSILFQNENYIRLRDLEQAGFHVAYDGIPTIETPKEKTMRQEINLFDAQTTYIPAVNKDGTLWVPLRQLLENMEFEIVYENRIVNVKIKTV